MKRFITWLILLAIRTKKSLKDAKENPLLAIAGIIAGVSVTVMSIVIVTDYRTMLASVPSWTVVILSFITWIPCALLIFFILSCILTAILRVSARRKDE
jgi:membrane-associated HD superfamily phosphohydrolase